MSARALPRVVVMSPHWPGWRWHERHFPEVTWDFFSDEKRYSLERRIRTVDVARTRGCFEAAIHARLKGASLSAVHGPNETALVASFAKLLGAHPPIVAFSFNYTELPSGPRMVWLRRVFRAVDRFVVYSSIERQLYARHFELPEERFETVLWSVAPPSPTPGGPIEQGDYVCAIGGNARDYPLLMEAARHSPEIPVVLVARQHNLTGLAVPPHVRVRVDMPLSDTMNVLKHCRFMVLPLTSSQVPCGHVTLVAAMHLGKAFVITGSSGVADYVLPERNALTVPAGDSEALAAAMHRLWQNQGLCVALAAEGQRFALEHCSESTSIRHLRGLLSRYLQTPLGER